MQANHKSSTLNIGKNAKYNDHEVLTTRREKKRLWAFASRKEDLKRIKDELKALMEARLQVTLEMEAAKAALLSSYYAAMRAHEKLQRQKWKEVRIAKKKCEADTQKRKVLMKLVAKRRTTCRRKTK